MYGYPREFDGSMSVKWDLFFVGLRIHCGGDELLFAV